MITLGTKKVGDGEPVFVIAEIGINHNGDLETAKKLIDGAVMAGCDAVKFQKRTPELCVPENQRSVMRETPWGVMTYLDYKKRVEFEKPEYTEIDRYCKERGILWFASCWDEPSVDFIEDFDPPVYKIASACLTDDALLKHTRDTGKPIILSTGMSTMKQIEQAVSILGKEQLLIAHSTSSYPCPPEELNIRMIPTLKKRFGCHVGYSGHETGLQTTHAAVALGATFIERHITLDRSMWGSDQAASVEPFGFMRLIRDMRAIQKAMGDGVKRVTPTEKTLIKRLRKVA